MDREALRAWCALHDPQLPAVTPQLAPLRQLLAALGGVRPGLPEARDEGRETAEEVARVDGGMAIGGGNVTGDGQAQRVDHEVPFATIDALVAVIAARASGLLDNFHTLTVHDRRTRVLVAAHPLALGSKQGGIESVPDLGEAQAPEMVKHCLPRREVGGQLASGAAGAQHVEDGVEDAAQGMTSGSAAAP